MIAWWLLLVCRREDPELATTARAVSAWEEGKSKLQAGDPAGAREHFQRAAELRPSPLLDAWQAQAMAAQGDLQGAIALLDRVIDARPTFGPARYNRAAYKARLGQLEAAAQDLRLALDDGARPALEVLDDPDFSPHLSHEAFAFLPKETLTVLLEPPPPTAFWGAEIPLSLTVSGLMRQPLAVESGTGSGPVELVGVTEETESAPSGKTTRLQYRFRVVGPGQVVLGPIVFRSGEIRASTGAVTIEASAPEDKVTPEVEPIAFPLPSALAAQVPKGSAAKVDGVLVAHAESGDRVVTEPMLGPAARLEVRQGPVPLSVLHRFRAGLEVHRVRILASDGTVRFDSTARFDSTP